MRIVKHQKTGKFLALKTLKKNEIIRLKQVEHILSEKQILGKIEHPFIVNLVSCTIDTRFLYFVLPFIPSMP